MKQFSPQLFKYGIGITSDFQDIPILGNEPEAEKIHVPPGKTVTLVEKPSSHIALRSVDIRVEEGASLTYIIFQNTNDSHIEMVERTAAVARNASMHVVDIHLGGRKIKSSSSIRLAGEGASAQIDGLFFGGNEQLFDLYHQVTHAAPYTVSRIAAKGALNGAAKTIYRNLIHIEPAAHHSRGFERADTLLLSDAAEINAIPDLTIENNEVQCSHAVTTTFIDEEKKFYLESRGMSEAEAVEAVIAGHFAPVVENIPDEAMRREIEQKFKYYV